jgi:hypothetical protein
MSNPHNAEGAPVAPQPRQRRSHPLQHGAGVAAGRGRHADATARAKLHIYMVETRRGRADHLHGGALQQPPVAAGAGADYQRVGVGHIRRADLRPAHVTHLGQGLQNPAQKRYVDVGNNLHDAKLLKKCYLCPKKRVS